MKMLMKKYEFWLKCAKDVFALMILTFSFYVVTFYLGNHDWPFVRYGMRLSEGMWEGRITQFILPYFVFMGQVIPIFPALLGFFFYALAAVLLAKWYAFPQKKIYVEIFSLLIVLHPYICSQLYYVHTVVSILCWPLLCVIGVICAWRFADKFEIKWLICSLAFLWTALAGYAACIELMLVMVVGKFLLSTLSGHSSDKANLRRFAILFGVVFLSVGLLLLSVNILKSVGVLNTRMYNVQTLGIKDALKIFIEFWYEPFKTMTYSLPYEKGKVLMVSSLLLLIVLKIALNHRKNLIVLLGCVGLIYSAFILVYLSPYGIFHTIRIHCFSVSLIVPVLYAFIVIYGKRFERNLACVLALILVFLYVGSDFMTQKVWHLGTKQDERMADRVREEIVPQLDLNKHYRLSTVGSFYGRQKFAGVRHISADERERLREYYGYGFYLYAFFSSGLFLYENKNPIWGDADYLGNYLQYRIARDSLYRVDEISAYVFARHFGNDKEKLVAAADKLCAYPCINYFYIGEKDILLMVSDDEISRLVLKWNIEHD